MKFLSRAALGVVLALGLVLGGGAIAATAAPQFGVEVVDEGGFAFTLPRLADAVQIVVTVLLPLIVGVITRRQFQHKALVLLVLAAVTGLGTEALATLQAGGVYDVGLGIVRAVLSLGGAVLLHYGFLKPEGITAAAQRLGPQ